MPKYDVPRRDFLKGAGTSLLSLMFTEIPEFSFAAQRQDVRGFDSLRTYAISEYDKVRAYNRAEQEKRVAGQNYSERVLPRLFDGRLSGRRVLMHILPKLPSEEYSLETQVFFAESGIPMPGVWDMSSSPSNLFLDRGFKGNLASSSDVVMEFSVNRNSMEFSTFVGDGTYQFAHFVNPARFSYTSQTQMEREVKRRTDPIIAELTKLKFSASEVYGILGALEAHEGPNFAYGHVPMIMNALLDGIAWYAPSGNLRAYVEMRFGLGLPVKVGNQPRSLGAYSKMTHEELQRRGNQGIANGEKQYRQFLQMTIDSLVRDGKI